ncbi:MAG: sensor histidine kinase KdpD [Chloroflexi bacterium]|nr:sensor histidine kinase KdpD [Chloroflexota bacterium]
MPRPTPDQLLHHIHETETPRGRLYIFMGYAAGVGKTYAMLSAAQSLRAQGVDVVVGYVETHGRAETDALLANLESIPRRTILYRGITLSEMDTDAILARRPHIVLVDELAHTNAPTSRHTKRYGDVEELLAAGINVYTTLNIQHLESLNNVVEQITGIKVQETIPDRLLPEAAEVRLIDLAVPDLLERLRQGKVYIPQQARRATERFFRQGNLNALRELALRRTADRVDEQLRSYMQTHAIAGPWETQDKLLVAISPSPHSHKLVRTAARLGQRLDANWTAVFVDTGQPLNNSAQAHLNDTVQLVESLGGEVQTLYGRNVAETLVDYARLQNISRLMIGMPIHRYDFGRPSLVEEIAQYGYGLDLYVISGHAPHETPPPTPTTTWLNRPWPWRPIILAALYPALATLASLPLRPYIEPANLVMIYLLAVVVTAWQLGRTAAIIASVVSMLLFNFIFIPPYYTFHVYNTQYFFTFAVLLAVGVVISTLTGHVREQEQAAQLREANTAALYELSLRLSHATTPAIIAQAVITSVEKTFACPSALWGGATAPTLLSHSTSVVLTDMERAVVDWSYTHGQRAGQGTNTLTAAQGHYIPLRIAQQTVGLLALYLDGRPLTLPQNRLLDSFANQAALALQRAYLAEQLSQTQLLEASEKLQTALLSSISHDFRTPLATITGSLSSLLDEQTDLPAPARTQLLRQAQHEAERLNRFIANLLEMTRLEAGHLRLRQEPTDVQDLLGVVLEQMAWLLADRTVQIQLPPDLPLVKVDFVLMVQVLVNLLENAHKYSPPESPIAVTAVASPPELLLHIADHGRGIPAHHLEHIFDKFYRLDEMSDTSGTGLGLSISKGIVVAHGGRIWADNQPTGQGTIFTVALPIWYNA